MTRYTKPFFEGVQVTVHEKIESQRDESIANDLIWCDDRTAVSSPDSGDEQAQRKNEYRQEKAPLLVIPLETAADTLVKDTHPVQKEKALDKIFIRQWHPPGTEQKTYGSSCERQRGGTTRQKGCVRRKGRDATLRAPNKSSVTYSTSNLNLHKISFLVITRGASRPRTIHIFPLIFAKTRPLVRQDEIIVSVHTHISKQKNLRRLHLLECHRLLCVWSPS